MSSKYNFPGIFSCLLRHNKGNIKAGFERKMAFTTIFMVLMAKFIVIFILTPSLSVGAQSIEQRVEPAIVMGGDLPNFTDVAIDEIWVYAYVGGEWKQIPFQIDERNDINGSYFFDAIDGILDTNDEIVFMPFDAGEAAPSTSWVPNTEPQRYEITVTDPIDSSVKYVYIYNSSNLTKTFTEDYVYYDPISHVIKATDYTVGFDDNYIGIMDEMRINTSAGGDNTDILDRFKFRFQITPIITPKQVKEEDFDYNRIDYRDGPVRVIQKVTQQNETEDFFVRVDNTVYAYKSFLHVVKAMSINTSADWVRISLDFFSNSIPMKYYDSNLNHLTINGSPDTPTSTDIPTWAEVTGSHGTVITIGDFSELAGTQSLYYNDNNNSDDQPESEPGEYGNHGIRITDLEAGSPSMNFSYYFLPADQGNIGSKYDNYLNNPLTITTSFQYTDPTPPPEIIDIMALPDPQEVVGYVNISAIIEDNLGELYGTWINITDPNGYSVGNDSMDYDTNTNRYYYDGTYGILGTYTFIIWTADTSGNWNSSSGQFVMHDITLPTITDVISLPDPQEVNGYVNISAIVTDFEVYGAWVTIKNPNGFSVGNFTMSYDSNTGRYYHSRAYGNVGAYQFIVWANDTSSNWNSSSGQFLIQDMTPPTANAGLDQAINKDTIVVFDGSGSSDNIEIVNYTWTFTDITLQTLFGTNPTHMFNNVGNFEVTLKVSDTAGNWDTDTMWINVSEVIMTGSISGAVRDEDGNPIEGATVRLVGTFHEATTNGTGYYMIPNIMAGIYDIEVTMNGYGTETNTQVTIQAGQDRLNENFALEKVSEKETGNYIWVILIIVIVLVIIFILFSPKFLPKRKKERWREKVGPQKELPQQQLPQEELPQEVLPQEEFEEEPVVLAEIEELVEEEPIELPSEPVVERVAAQGYDEDYEDSEGLLEGIEIEERESEPEGTLTPEDLGGLSPEIIDIERELEELLKEQPKPTQPKEELKDELKALSEEIDKILNDTEEKDVERKNKKD